MKPIYLLFIINIVIGTSSCNQFESILGKQVTAPSIDTILYQNETEISFENTFYDLGNVNEGDSVRIVYYFTNSGQHPLILKNVKPSCGCTLANYNHRPIAAGQRDSIIAHFDSKGKDGSYQKNIQVTTNTNPATRDVMFKVNVIKKK